MIVNKILYWFLQTMTINNKMQKWYVTSYKGISLKKLVTYRFSPMPIASVATRILQGWLGSLNLCAWASLVPGGRPEKQTVDPMKPHCQHPTTLCYNWYSAKRVGLGWCFHSNFVCHSLQIYLLLPSTLVFKILYNIPLLAIGLIAYIPYVKSHL